MSPRVLPDAAAVASSRERGSALLAVLVGSLCALGKSGLAVSALSFGSWVTFGTQLGDSEARACMQAACDAGVNFFDNAESYAAGQSETIMGLELKKLGWRRSNYVV